MTIKKTDETISKSKSLKGHATKRQLAARSLSDAKELVAQLNKAITDRCGEFGVDRSVLQSHTQANVKTDPSAMGKRANDKVLNAIYTLLDANIEAIVLNGLIIGMSDTSATGASMVRYWVDKYTPQEQINKTWDKGEQSNSITFLQQAIQVKMMVDASGKSLDEVLKGSQSLVETTSIEAKDIINED